MIPEDLLKKATSEKKKGNIDKAIEILRKALIEAEKEYGFPFGIEQCLRLPLYLQIAGKTNEAWKEFNKLLIKCISKNSFSDCSKIHDKMRLFLERDKKYNEAVKHAILSYLYDAIATYHLAKQYKWGTDSYTIYFTDDKILKYLNKILKKIKKKDLTESLLKIILECGKELPCIEFSNVNMKLNQIL